MFEEKKSFLDKLIPFSILVYSFFLSRRGGDTKDIISILIMTFIFIYSYKNKIKRYLYYKKEIFISIAYLFLVSISYFIINDKDAEKFYTFLHMTFYSIGFMLVLFNYKLENKYIKYILPLLIVLSLSSIYKGILELYEHYSSITGYRIAGGTYTTKYAAELGVYFLLGVFSIAYYKKIYIRLLLVPYIIINLGLISLTQSRNSFIAIPLTIIFLYTIVDWKKGIIILLILLGSLGILFKYNYNIRNVVRNIDRIKGTFSTV